MCIGEPCPIELVEPVGGLLRRAKDPQERALIEAAREYVGSWSAARIGSVFQELSEVVRSTRRNGAR